MTRNRFLAETIWAVIFALLLFNAAYWASCKIGLMPPDPPPATQPNV